MTETNAGVELGGASAREPVHPSPLADWQIIEGEPVARNLDLTAASRASANLWDCTAGRFRWYYAADEVVHVLEGEAHLDDGSGEIKTMRAGDVVHFRPGHEVVWHVPAYVKKLAVHRRLAARRAAGAAMLLPLLPEALPAI
jgi:uncharacterized cupin superfamily protein